MLPTLKIPAVNIGHALADDCISSVINDEEAIGEMAAEHLLLQGYRAFGYCTQTGGVLDGRLVGYQKGLRRRGVDCQVFDVRDALAHPERYPERRLPTWLKSQPRPLGLFCMYDRHARELSRECAALGLRVPEDVAILGVDNDVNCLLGHPQLSSVQTAVERIGFEAAQLLDELLSRSGKNRVIRSDCARGHPHFHYRDCGERQVGARCASPHAQAPRGFRRNRTRVRALWCIAKATRTPLCRRNRFHPGSGLGCLSARRSQTPTDPDDTQPRAYGERVRLWRQQATRREFQEGDRYDAPQVQGADGDLNGASQSSF